MPEQHEYQIDINGIVKLVTVRRLGRMLYVTVKYATEVLADRATIEFSVADPVQISQDAFGVVVRYRAPLLPFFGWPMARRSRRF